MVLQALGLLPIWPVRCSSNSPGHPTLSHIPYKGGGPGISDLVSGHIPMMMLNITGQVLELHKTGRIRIVAVFTPKRLAVLPNVQAASETFPSLVAVLFTGLFAPSATPKAVIEQIGRANRTAIRSEDFKGKLVAAGLEPVLDTPQEAQRFVDAEGAPADSTRQVDWFKLE